MIGFSKHDINRSMAERAYTGTSFSPERRAEGIASEYVTHMERVVRRLTPAAETEEQKAILKAELSRYKTGYLVRLNAYLEARSRVLSPMITGPARFPVDRNQKAARVAAKRVDDLEAWSERAFDSIKKKLINTRTPGQQAEAEFRRLKARIDGGITALVEIEQGSPFDPTAFKNSIAGVIKRSADAGNIEAARRAVEYLGEAQKVLAKPAFTARHSIWTYVDKVEVAAQQTRSQSGTETIAEYNGVTIVNNHDEERIQILLDDKPSEDIRSALRGAGWRWSRRHSAWQRKNTDNAVYSAKRIVERFFDEGK